MTQEPAIIGFRQDRVGARITGIVSLMRLAHAFGATTRFAWLAQPDGPWPELSDPTAFFTPDFVASHIVVVDRAPPLDGRRSLHAESAHLNRANFARALAKPSVAITATATPSPIRPGVPMGRSRPSQARGRAPLTQRKARSTSSKPISRIVVR